MIVTYDFYYFSYGKLAYTFVPLNFNNQNNEKSINY